MNYIKISQNAQALSVSVVNYYSEDQLMHTFLYDFYQGGNYSAQVASHQAELGREERFNDQKYLSILSLQNYYLNLDVSSGLVKQQTLFRQSALLVEVLITLQKNISKGSDRKKKKLVRLVIPTKDKQNGHLENVLDVDIKITKLKNDQRNQRKTRNGKSKSFS